MKTTVDKDKFKQLVELLAKHGFAKVGNGKYRRSNDKSRTLIEVNHNSSKVYITADVESFPHLGFYNEVTIGSITEEHIIELVAWLVKCEAIEIPAEPWILNAE